MSGSGPQGPGPGPGFTIPGSHGHNPDPRASAPDAYGQTQLSAGAAPAATVVGEPIVPALAAPAKKAGGKKGLLLVLGAALVVLGGAAFSAYWFWWRATGPELARYVPKDTHYYIEAPSLPKLLVSLKGVDFLDDKELDLEGKREEISEALSDSFDLKKDEATALLESLRSAAVAIKVNEISEDEKDDETPATYSVFLLKVSDAEAVDPLFEGKRFKKDGSFAGGTRYRLSRRKLKVDDDDRDRRRDRTLWQEMFDDMGVYRFEDLPKRVSPDGGEVEKTAEEEEADEKRKAKEEIAVWYEEEKLLVYGDPALIKEVGKVIDGSKESLEKGNEQFAAVKWEPSSTLLEYFDPSAFDDLKKDFFDGVAPYTTSGRLDDEGLITVMRAELSGKKVQDYSELVPEAVELDLYEKLPASTFAYLAIGTKLKGSGKDWTKALKKTVRNVDEKTADELEKNLEELEEEIGFSLETALDALGDQLVIAGIGDDKLMGAATSGDERDIAENLAVVGIVHLRDASAAEKVVKAAKEKAQKGEENGKVSVKKLDGGFALTIESGERGPDVYVRVEIIEDKHLFVAGGGKKQVERAREAFDGEGDLLKSDGAHKRALGVLEDKGQVLGWVDAGRIARVFLKGNSEAKREARKKGFPVDAFILEDDKRVTSGFSVLVTVDEERVQYEARALNYPFFFGPAVAFLSFNRRMAAISKKYELEKEKEREPLPSP